MIKFTADIAAIKKALAITALATGKITNHIQSEALFSIEGNNCFLCSSDEDKVAESSFTLNDVEGGDIKFTANPKNIQKLLSGSKTAKFTYEPETKTLKVYTSENKKSYLSFASFDPEKFLSPSLSSQELQYTVNKEVFLDGIKFAQGFTIEKDEKFSNVYIIDGVFYGANGNSRVGAFASIEIAETPDLILRKPMLSPIMNMVEKADISEVVIKTSEKLITFSSPDDVHHFGFRKSTAKIPKFPISVKTPDFPKFNIDSVELLKTLNRLSLTSWEDIGIKMSVKDGNLEMETVAERSSFETMPCKCDSEEPIDFIIQCNKFKAVLGLFKASNVDVYIAKNKCTIFSNADIEITEEGKEEPIIKSFTAAGLITLARLVK